MIPLDDALRPQWLFGATVHEGCDRAGYYEQGDFATEYGSPKCIVKLGCWGPVVNCNVPEAGLDQRRRRVPERRRHLHRLHDAGLPRQVHAVHGRAARAQGSPRWRAASTARSIRGLRRITQKTVNEEPKWRTPGTKLLDRLQGRSGGSTMATTKTEGRPTASSRWRGTRSPASSGSLGIYTKIDFGQGKVAECHSTSSIFRGYSIFMKGKDPRDAHFITSRICGICGDNHATCSCYAQNMAYGVHPPALGEQIVNLGEAAEYMFDHNIFQENLVGVDFCEKMVAETNPGVLELANRTEAPHAADHGYTTIGDIMRSLNPFSGEFYREALQVSRYTREMFCLMEGRHVHPSTLYPGGVGTTATIQLFTDYYTRLMRYVEFMKRVVPMHDDLFDFFYEALPGLRGGRPPARPARLLGRLPGPRRLQLRLQGHDASGAGPWASRPASSSTASWSPTTSSTSTSASASSSAARSTTDWEDQEMFVTTGPARQPGRPPPPVEPAHHPAAAEARLRRQVQLGDVAALVRRHRPPRPRHRRRPDRPPVVDGAVGARRTPTTSRRPARAWRSTCRGPR